MIRPDEDSARWLRDAHPDLPGDCDARWAARPGVRRHSQWRPHGCLPTLPLRKTLVWESGVRGWVSRRLGEDVLSRETALPDRLAASGRAVVWSTRECDTSADGSRGSGSGRTASPGRGAGVPAMRDGSAGRAWLGTGPVAAEDRWAGDPPEGAR